MGNEPENSLLENLIAILAKPEMKWRISSLRVSNRPVFRSDLDSYHISLIPSIKESPVTLIAYERGQKIKEWEGRRVDAIYQAVNQRMAGVEAEKATEKENSLVRLKQLVEERQR